MIFILAVILIVGLVYAESAPASTWNLGHFTRYVGSVVRANLPLGSSLSAYAQDLPGWRFGKRQALVGIADTVDNGLSLADALDGHPALFPRYYRALVRAGENGGNLASMLDRLADTVDFDAQLARRTAGYSLYPAALATFALSGMAILVVLVAPKLQYMAQEAFLVDGPPVIPLVLGAAQLALAAFLVFGGIALLSFLGPSVWRRLGKAVPGLAAAWSWLTWHLPPVSRYERRWAVSQYALVAGRLMEAGVPTHEALKVASGASGNSHFDGIARAAVAQVAEGQRLSDALKHADPRRELPPEFLWYVEVGEASGKLPEALLKASESAAARSRSALSRLVGLVFPAGIILIAVIVGMMGYAMFGMLVALMEGMM